MLSHNAAGARPALGTRSDRSRDCRRRDGRRRPCRDDVSGSLSDRHPLLMPTVSKGGSGVSARDEALRIKWKRELGVPRTIQPFRRHAKVVLRVVLRQFGAPLAHGRAEPPGTLDELPKRSEAFPFFSKESTPGMAPEIVDSAKVSRVVADLVAQVHKVEHGSTRSSFSRSSRRRPSPRPPPLRLENDNRRRVPASPHRSRNHCPRRCRRRLGRPRMRSRARASPRAPTRLRRRPARPASRSSRSSSLRNSVPKAHVGSCRDIDLR
jgi:hypothetical protein